MRLFQPHGKIGDGPNGSGPATMRITSHNVDSLTPEEIPALCQNTDILLIQEADVSRADFGVYRRAFARENFNVFYGGQPEHGTSKARVSKTAVVTAVRNTFAAVRDTVRTTARLLSIPQRPTTRYPQL